MKWELWRRLFTIAGIFYVLALIPSSIRPSWNAAPFRKPEQTITMSLGPNGENPSNYDSRISDACQAPTLLRPLMGSAKQVRVVIASSGGQPIDVRDVDCETYI